MRVASGEPYRYHLTSQAKERIGTREVVRDTDFLGLQFFSRECRGNLCTGTYFDGTRLFAVDMNDTALPVGAPDRSLRAMRFVNSGSFLSPAFARGGGTLADLGTITSEGKVYRALGVNAPDAIPLVVWVDPTTFLIRSVRDWSGQLSFEDGDYRRVGPLMLPFQISQNGTVVQAYQTRRVDPAPFQVPRGLVPVYDSSSSQIRIDNVSRDTPIVPCVIAQVQVKCLIDTGNSGVSLSLQIVEQLHLESIGAFEVRGLGHYATEVVRAGPLKIGNAEFPAANYVVLHDIHQNGYDVVLGADVLANSTVTIDYADHTVSFSPNASAAADSSVALSFINFVPVVAVQLGKVNALLAVDTGDESTINLSFDYYTHHSDLFTATEARSVTGVGGNSEQLLGEIAQVRLGEFRVESQRIGTTRSLHSTAEGHLGGGFLSHFRVVLEYARARLGLTPRSGDAAVHP
ncbi:MAG: hypothetical protein NVSMB31_00960 [Vulcanimicrobiaceae bacterium]